MTPSGAYNETTVSVKTKINNSKSLIWSVFFIIHKANKSQH
jgi:hypothetical protein